jgi:hypothetical protein
MQASISSESTAGFEFWRKNFQGFEQEPELCLECFLASSPSFRSKSQNYVEVLFELTD